MTEPTLASMSREHRLDIACVTVHALLDLATLAVASEEREITRRRHEALALIEETPLPTAVFEHPSAQPRLVNAAWRALFSRAEWTELAPRVAGMYGAASHGASMHVAELTLESAGHPAHCAATLRPMLEASGAVLGVIVVCIVTTDEVVARELGVGPDTLIWSAPIPGEVDFFNARWRAYVGNSTAYWHAAIVPDDLARCTAAFGQASRDRMSSDVEVRVLGAGGEARWHRVRFSTGRLGTRWFGTAVDIHDSRDVEAKLCELVARERAARADAEQANRLKDQFLAAVSHELRAPLTTMLLWEKVLSDDATEPPLRARALEAIHESALSQSHLVGDLLDVSRAVSGKLFVDLRPIGLETILASAIAAIAGEAEARGVIVHRAGAATVGDVLGDAARLRQVFDNLLSNAVKFTQTGGTITITVERRGRTLAVEVADTGRGIAPDYLSHLFEPFSQHEDTLTRRAGGLGLGLTIAKQLVELHHGTLTATSAGLGRGAAFTVCLPLSIRKAALPPAGVPHRLGLDGVQVLVVDDDRRVRDALELLLRRTGAAVECADTADVARAKIRERSPHVIVCDVAMPGEDGYEFVAQLRSSGQNVPAIALTAHATEIDVKRALSAGFDVHLAKPIDFERLVAAIDRLIRARRSSPNQNT